MQLSFINEMILSKIIFLLFLKIVWVNLAVKDWIAIKGLFLGQVPPFYDFSSSHFFHESLKIILEFFLFLDSSFGNLNF